MSYAQITTSNEVLTPMRVTYDGIDLGATLGNVVVSIKYSKSNILADQSGTTVRDRRVSGIEITVTTELAEILKKDTMKVAFPNAVKLGTGTNDLAALDFVDAIGAGDQALAAELILHPLDTADVNLGRDWIFYKAIASAEASGTYGPTEQTRYKVTWNILPDESATPNKFMRYGDPAVV